MPASDGVRIEIEALGDVQISRKLLRFGDRALDAKAVWPQIFEDLMRIEEVQFLTEGSHGGGGDKWAPLADSTVAQKERLHQQPWIERATEALYNSLTKPMSAGQVHEVSPTMARFGTDVPYAGFQQKGTSKMPQRKLMDLTLTERRLIVKSIQRFLIEGVAASIFE